MAGRVHGRVAGGRVYILSDRDIHFASLRPTEPEFQLAGDSERVALTCAGARRARRRARPAGAARPGRRTGSALALLESRGLVEQGRLTDYGRAVEAMPVDRAVGRAARARRRRAAAVPRGDGGIESLHRMTREDRDLKGLVLPGQRSPHGVQRVRRGVRRGAATSARCTACRGTCSTTSASSAWAGAARRAGEVAGGRGAGDGERLSQRGPARCPRRMPLRARAHAAPVRRAARASSCRSTS